MIWQQPTDGIANVCDHLASTSLWMSFRAQFATESASVEYQKEVCKMWLSEVEHTQFFLSFPSTKKEGSFSWRQTCNATAWDSHQQLPLLLQGCPEHFCTSLLRHILRGVCRGGDGGREDRNAHLYVLALPASLASVFWLCLASGRPSGNQRVGWERTHGT